MITEVEMALKLNDPPRLTDFRTPFSFITLKVQKAMSEVETEMVRSTPDKSCESRRKLFPRKNHIRWKIPRICAFLPEQIFSLPVESRFYFRNKYAFSTRSVFQRALIV